jgi:hypothetical protein
MKRTLVQARVLATAVALQCMARSVMLVRPRERWYWDSWHLSQLLSRLIRTLRPGILDPSLEARLLHRFLDVLTHGGRRFPIPVSVEGIEILEAVVAQKGGFVCCSAHVPFVKLFIPVVRQVLDKDAEIAVLVKYYPGRIGELDVWNGDPVRAIAVGPSVLLQARSLLRQGGCLMLLTDKEQGEYISSNIFRFVGKMGSRITMLFPHLLPDGTILLQCVEAPAPYCRNEVEVRSNLDFIAQNVRAILAGGEPPERVRPSVIPLAQVNVAQRGRELDRVQLYSRRQLEARAKRLEQLLTDQTIEVADRALYEKRLQLLRNELDIRARKGTRAEFGPDGRPLY